MTYKIKPLKWKRAAPEGYWQAESIFGELFIRQPSLGVRRSWAFKYCVDEYYDRGTIDAASFRDAKEKANKWYLERLMPALEEA